MILTQDILVCCFHFSSWKERLKEQEKARRNTMKMLVNEVDMKKLEAGMHNTSRHYNLTAITLWSSTHWVPASILHSFPVTKSRIMVVMMVESFLEKTKKPSFGLQSKGSIARRIIKIISMIITSRIFWPCSLEFWRYLFAEHIFLC